MGTQKQEVLERLTEADVQRVFSGLGVERFASGGEGHWLVRSPFREDRHPSFTIRKADGVWHDLATGEGGSIFDAVMRGRGEDFVGAVNEVARDVGIRDPGFGGPGGNISVQPRRIPSPESRTTYPYHDADGTLLYEMQRLVGAGGRKTFVARRPDGNAWVPQMGERRVLYRLPELLAADPWVPVFVVEGEKDVDRLHALGLVATTCPNGAGAWREEYNAALAGREVVIIPDNDLPGEQHAIAVARALRGVASAVRLLRLAGLPEKGDVSDWLDAGGNAEELSRLAAECPVVEDDRVTVVPLSAFEAIEMPVSQVEAKEVQWLWPGWLPLGKLTILGGYAGVGKSTLAAGFASIVSRGGDWPDGAPGTGQPGFSIFLLTEDAVDDTLRPRLEQLGADIDQVSVLSGVRRGDGREEMFSLRQHIDALEALIVRRQAKLVVLDPLSAFQSGSNRNDEGDTRDLLTPLARLAERTGCAVLGLSHIGKPTPGTRKTPLQMLMGATAVGAIARLVMMAGTVPGTDRNLLAVVKSNLSQLPRGVEWSRETNAPFTWHGPSSVDIETVFGGAPAPAAPRKADVAETFLREILADGPMLAKTVIAEAEELGISDSTLKRARFGIGVIARRYSSGWYWTTTEDAWAAFLQQQTGQRAIEMKE